MTWKITPTYTYDSQAAAYISAVETADGQALEVPVKVAINEFVLGCKRDGIWDAIKASCILAGARTLNGALVPLVGTAPTNFNFVAGDYNRKTGLFNSGGKYIDSNRSNNADPQNSSHNVAFSTQLAASNFIMGTATGSGDNALAPNLARSRNSAGVGLTATTGFIGAARSASSTFTVRNGGKDTTTSTTSQSPSAPSLYIFAANNGTGASGVGIHRLAFYSIGEALDLALYEARLVTLIAQFAAAIP